MTEDLQEKSFVEVEFLYWRDCPSWEIVLERLRNVLRDIESEFSGKVSFKILLREVKTDEDAENLKFPGSPTIRVFGKDIDPEGEKQNIVGLTCRVYEVDGKITPTPSESFIKERIKKILSQKLVGN